jgi:hypothetical protein
MGDIQRALNGRHPLALLRITITTLWPPVPNISGFSKEKLWKWLNPPIY